MSDITYVKVNGTSYRSTTPREIIDVLESARLNNIRIELEYGVIETGQSWGEVCGIQGYVGRSTGTVKIPILVYNKRSIGGGGILDNHIVRIRTTRGKKVLYQHHSYKPYLES